MTAAPTCPRCLDPVRPPGLWSSAWTCETHGDVLPFRAARPSHAALEGLVGRARVPVWMLAPLPPGWTVTGAGSAGDERTGARATVVVLSGPAPLGGAADVAVVAEEPGVGLGARLAGLPSADPGEVLRGRPEAKIDVRSHPTALWPVRTLDDRGAFVGEGLGVWLWMVFAPEPASALLLESLALADLRDGIPDLAFGAPSSLLGMRPIHSVA